VYIAQLDPAQGRELKKTRPVVIVSNNSLNEFSDMVIAVPITSGMYQYAHDIPINPPEGGLKKESAIIVEQVRAMDIARLGRRLGKINLPTMLAIEQALRDHLGLPEGNILP
jgi:mRNA interferase MazF